MNKLHRQIQTLEKKIRWSSQLSWNDPNLKGNFEELQDDVQELKKMMKEFEQEKKEYSNRLDNGRDWLMKTPENEVTVKQALKEFGFDELGHHRT